MYNVKLITILYDWQLSMASFCFCEHIYYTWDRSWSTRVRLVHSWAACKLVINDRKRPLRAHRRERKDEMEGVMLCFIMTWDIYTVSLMHRGPVESCWGKGIDSIFWSRRSSRHLKWFWLRCARLHRYGMLNLVARKFVRLMFEHTLIRDANTCIHAARMQFEIFMVTFSQ